MCVCSCPSAARCQPILVHAQSGESHIQTLGMEAHDSYRYSKSLSTTCARSMHGNIILTCEGRRQLEASIFLKWLTVSHRALLYPGMHTTKLKSPEFWASLSRCSDIARSIDIHHPESCSTFLARAGLVKMGMWWFNATFAHRNIYLRSHSDFIMKRQAVQFSVFRKEVSIGVLLA